MRDTILAFLLPVEFPMIEVRDGKFYRLPPEGSIPCGRDRATRLVECEFVLSFKWISSF